MGCVLELDKVVNLSNPLVDYGVLVSQYDISSGNKGYSSKPIVSVSTLARKALEISFLGSNFLVPCSDMEPITQLGFVTKGNKKKRYAKHKVEHSIVFEGRSDKESSFEGNTQYAPPGSNSSMEKCRRRAKAMKNNKHPQPWFSVMMLDWKRW